VPAAETATIAPFAGALIESPGRAPCRASRARSGMPATGGHRRRSGSARSSTRAATATTASGCGAS